MLDRNVQLKILEALAIYYPNAGRGIPDQLGIADEVSVPNLYYLHEHGLISAKFYSEHGQGMHVGKQIKITAAGMDFLADDGGVGAILGTVIIKIHQDSIKQIIESKIQAADLPEQEKTGLLKAVRELPGEAMSHLTTKLLDLGMDNLPAAFELIRKALHNL